MVLAHYPYTHKMADQTVAHVATVSRLLRALRQLVTRYEDMVVRDPDFTSKLESGLRLASYLVPGRIGGSWALSELAYCISNLYALLNDYIITKKCPASSPLNKHPQKHRSLMWTLSVLECVEVVNELFAEKFLNEPGKWATIILLQMSKALLRSYLVFRLRAGLLTSPPTPSPDRRKAQALHSQPELEDGRPLAWKAPRTGKVVRSIHADSSLPYSQLHHHVSPPSPTNGHNMAAGLGRPASLKLQQLIAEGLYITRPLTHIISMFVFQQKSWKPWVISLAIDLVSLHLHGGLATLKSPEKSEILRRRVVLLLYLLRSPFYDAYTKGVLVHFLKALSSTIPLLYLIIDPVLTYLPVWQQTYSYNWMT